MTTYREHWTRIYKDTKGLLKKTGKDLLSTKDRSWRAFKAFKAPADPPVDKTIDMKKKED